MVNRGFMVDRQKDKKMKRVKTKRQNGQDKKMKMVKAHPLFFDF